MRSIPRGAGSATEEGEEFMRAEENRVKFRQQHVALPLSGILRLFPAPSKFLLNRLLKFTPDS
jgi:hypothetical protein